MTNFVEFENKNRNGQYKKDHEVEKFLKDINLNLQNAETYEENLNDLPNIFIFKFNKVSHYLPGFCILFFDLDICDYQNINYLSNDSSFLTKYLQLVHMKYFHH